MLTILFAILDAAFAAMNFAFYAADSGRWWNLAAGVFCGLLVFVQLAMYRSSR